MDFDTLRRKIRSCLGQDAGIDTSEAHLDELMSSMKSYISVDDQWERWALQDSSRAYTRNLVDECNGNANLLVLCWNPGKKSPIHCHSSAHCIMKILSGRLVEELYEWPEDSQSMVPAPATRDNLTPMRTAEQEKSMNLRKITTLHRDDVTYISDRLGLHRIGNPSDSEIAISLHLYTPPWAAKYGCQIFNEKTGQSHRTTKCGFYSIGRKSIFIEQTSLLIIFKMDNDVFKGSS